MKRTTPDPDRCAACRAVLGKTRFIAAGGVLQLCLECYRARAEYEDAAAARAQRRWDRRNIRRRKKA